MNIKMYFFTWTAFKVERLWLINLMDSGNKQWYGMIMDGEVVFGDDGVLVIEGIYEIICKK